MTDARRQRQRYEIVDPEVSHLTDEELSAYLHDWSTKRRESTEVGDGRSSYWVGEILDRGMREASGAATARNSPKEPSPTPSRTRQPHSPTKGNAMEDPDGCDDGWPGVAPTVILPRLSMGGIEEDQYLGSPLAEAHYSFDSPYDVVLTLYADAQAAPWGVSELRYGFPDDDIPESLLNPCLPLAKCGWSAWNAGATVLVRCQQGINRSGLVTALILMLDGMAAHDAIALLRQRRGDIVLNNETFENWLLTRAPDHITPTVHQSTGDSHE